MQESNPADMHVSDELMHKLFAFEGKVGFNPAANTWHAYLDCAGVPTIYFGLTKGVKPGMIISDDDAKKMLAREIATYENAIAREIKVPLTQSRYDSAFDFTYNCGEGALSGAVKHSGLNKGNYSGFPGQIAQFTHYTDPHTHKLVYSSGLHARRLSEIAMWNHIDADIKPVDAPMPQAPQRAPVDGKIAAAANGWTVRGLLLSFAAAVANYAEQITGFASSIATDAQAQVDKAGPFTDLLGKVMGHANEIMFGVLIFGLAIALTRRFSAAANSKIG